MNSRDLLPNPLPWRRTVFPSLGFFTVTFGVWLLPGALIPIVAAAEGFDPRTSTGIVTFALLLAAGGRILVGLLTVRVDARLLAVGLACSAALGSTLLALPKVWRATPGLVAAALLLGLAGSTFPLVMATTAKVTAPESRGIALGVVGMGNAGGLLGGALAASLTPLLGWRFVPAMMAFGCMGVGTWYAWSVAPADPPKRGAAHLVATYASHLTPERTSATRIRIGAGGWGAATAYTVAFGNFLALVAALPLRATLSGLGATAAAGLGATAALAGTLARPAGGVMSDRLGDARSTVSSLLAGSGALVVAGVGATQSATPPALVGLAGLVAATMFFGFGAGASFAWVGRRAASSVGPLGGVAGAAGAAWGAGASRLLIGDPLNRVGYAGGVLLSTALTIVATGIVTALRRLEAPMQATAGRL